MCVCVCVCVCYFRYQLCFECDMSVTYECDVCGLINCFYQRIPCLDRWSWPESPNQSRFQNITKIYLGEKKFKRNLWVIIIIIMAVRPIVENINAACHHRLSSDNIGWRTFFFFREFQPLEFRKNKPKIGLRFLSITIAIVIVGRRSHWMVNWIDCRWMQMMVWLIQISSIHVPLITWMLLVH